MKIVVYGFDHRIAAIHGDGYVDLNWAYARYLNEVRGLARPYAHADAACPSDLEAFIQEGPGAIERAQLAIEHHAKNPEPTGARGERIVHSAQAKIHPPLPSMGARMAMAGGNFADHQRGFQVNRMHKEITVQQVYEEARAFGFWGFWTLPSNVIGPDDDMIYPAKTQRLDYEAEVAVILGKGGHDISEADAPSHYWGYTMLNDWSIRDGNYPSRGLSFNLQKNFDTSSSLGPCVVVGEIPDAQNIDFQTTVDGQVRQQGNTKDMVFSFAEFLAYLSKDQTFRPGDLMSGGTCAGTAADSAHYDANNVADPSGFLRPGHLVEVSSPQIGVLRNKVVSRS